MASRDFGLKFLASATTNPAVALEAEREQEKRRLQEEARVAVGRTRERLRGPGEVIPEPGMQPLEAGPGGEVAAVDFPGVQRLAPVDFRKVLEEEQLAPGGRLAETEPGKAFVEDLQLERAREALEKHIEELPEEEKATERNKTTKLLSDMGLTAKAVEFITQRTARPSVFEQKEQKGTPELKASNDATIDQLEVNDQISSVDAANLRGQNIVGVGAWAVAQELKKMSGKVTTAVRTGVERIPGKQQEEEELRAGRVETARQIAEATGRERTGQRLALNTEKMRQNFSKVEALFRNFNRQKMAQLRGEPIKGGGILIGPLKQAFAAARIRGFEPTGAFSGQRAETAFALNSIITGQNRVIEGLYNRILSTLPDELDPESFTIAKIEQSVRNAFGLLKAMQNSGLVDQLRTASDEDVSNADSDLNRQIASMGIAALDEEEEKQVQQVLDRIFSAGVAPVGGPTVPAPTPIVTPTAGGGEFTDEDERRLQELEAKARGGR